MSQDQSAVALDERSRHLRHLALESLEGGTRGHIGSTMSLIEILRVLYDSILEFDAKDPHWAHRDRLVLSKGHGCIALYVMLAAHGFFPEEELRGFCSYDSGLGGHPEHGHVPGVEASTGALGHGLSLAVGMAQAALVRQGGHRVYVVVGDGELNEGSIWEAALSAGHRKLSNLTVVVDYNKLQSYGPIPQVWELEPLSDKFSAFGFDVREVDGHDVEALEEALANPTDSKPTAVIAHTVKGKGIDFAEGRADWHHKSKLDGDEIQQLREAIDRA